MECVNAQIHCLVRTEYIVSFVALYLPIYRHLCGFEMPHDIRHSCLELYTSYASLLVSDGLIAVPSLLYMIFQILYSPVSLHACRKRRQDQCELIGLILLWILRSVYRISVAHAERHP